MLYFDCCCEIGPRYQKDPIAPWSVDHVLHWMDHCGIAGALVVHTLSIHDDPVQARKRLSEEIACAADRLFPVWTVLPPHAGDFESSESFVRALADANVRAVKMYPTSHGFPLCEAVIGSMLCSIEEHRILTLMDFGEIPCGIQGAFACLDDLLSQHPNLPFLLQRIPWAAQRTIAPLMERHANLHLELSTFQVHWGIEEYSKRFGSERLLFGSGLPAMSAGAARTYIDYAQLSTQAKTDIAGGNLTRLLGGLTPCETHTVRQFDVMRTAAATGKPLWDFGLFDAHCHILHEKGNGAGAHVMYYGDGDGMIRLRDFVGIKSTAIMSWTGPTSCDPITSNDIVSRAIESHPGRFAGVVYVEPAHLSPEELMTEIQYRVECQGFTGLKPYRWTGIRYDSIFYTECWEYANRHGLYILLHLAGPVADLNTVGQLAGQYPDAQWVVAHVGGSFERARETVALMSSRQNVWAELTLTSVTNGLIEWMVSQIGDDRILFGTDSPMRDPRQQLGWVVWADIPIESRQRILGDNFRRLLSMRKKSQQNWTIVDSVCNN